MTTYEKIVEYLNLQTLKGVEVEFEDGEKELFIHCDDEGNLISTYGESLAVRYKKDRGDFVSVKTITPIPQYPKVLEVGTKVKITESSKIWEIYSTANGGYRVGNERYEINCVEPKYVAYHEYIPQYY